jgi:homocysteine S-methyltransferase
MARVRMGALALCVLIQQQEGIETILHFTTCDRSLMGIQADLIGAHALGVRNIIALTGDPPSLGDQPDSTPVYDLGQEVDRLSRKISAGAHLTMTQPISDPAVWKHFVDLYEERHGPFPVPVLIGILPLQSHRHASFLHNEVPGITISESALARMERAGADGRREGVFMAQELLLELKGLPRVST